MDKRSVTSRINGSKGGRPSVFNARVIVSNFIRNLERLVSVLPKTVEDVVDLKRVRVINRIKDHVAGFKNTQDLLRQQYEEQLLKFNSPKDINAHDLMKAEFNKFRSELRLLFRQVAAISVAMQEELEEFYPDEVDLIESVKSVHKFSSRTFDLIIEDLLLRLEETINCIQLSKSDNINHMGLNKKKEITTLEESLSVAYKIKKLPKLEESNGSSPAVYVGTYAKYNSGSLEGKWMKLDDYSDYDDFLEAAKELHKDEEDPEFMFQDYENFPARFYGEAGLQKTDDLWAWIELDDDKKEAAEAFLDYDSGADLSDVEDRFYGKYNSKEDWAHEYIDGLGGLENAIGEDQLAHYLSMTDTDARLVAGEEASARAEDLRYSLKKEDFEEIFDQTDIYKDEYEKLQEKLDDSEDEDEQDKLKADIEKLAEKSIEEYEDNLSDDIGERLKSDAIGYFVDDLGLDMESVVKMSVMNFDYEKWARDVEMSGDFIFVDHKGDVYVFSA